MFLTGFGQEKSGMFLTGAGLAMGDVFQCSGYPGTANPLVPSLIPSRLRCRRASPILEGAEEGPMCRFLLRGHCTAPPLHSGHLGTVVVTGHKVGPELVTG